MLTTLKTESVTKWTWSGTGFVRESPGEKQITVPKFTLVFLRARYYDTQTGEFISRDPLEYVDGMSLYRGYFVPGMTDPSGKNPVIVVGGVVITVSAAEAIAASFGLTLAACLAHPECSKALIDAAQDAVDAVGDAAQQALDSAKAWVQSIVRWFKDCRLHCKLKLHNAHHYWPTPVTTDEFPFLRIKKCWRVHYQADCYLKGVPFSNISFKAPFGPCCKFKNCRGGIVH